MNDEQIDLYPLHPWKKESKKKRKVTTLPNKRKNR